MMLRTGDRILLSAFATVFAGAVGGWALLALLPAKAAPRPAPGTAALALAGTERDDTRPAAPPAAAPAPKASVKGAPPVPGPARTAPSATAQPEEAPASDHEFRLKLENGSLASFDPVSGRILLRTPFGSLELTL
jgi:hypothetical protein